MIEKHLLSWLLATSDTLGWDSWHVPAPMKWSQGQKKFVPALEAAGLPDVILACRTVPLLILAELKGDTGKLTVEQTHFLERASSVRDAIREAYAATAGYGPRPAVPVGVYAWWPRDQPVIETILRSKVLT